MATHKGMPCRIDLISMSLGLRVDVGPHVSVVKIGEDTNWLEKGNKNPPHVLDFYEVLDGYAVGHAAQS